MKTLAAVLGCMLLVASLALAQEPSVAEAKIRVFGNCTMCKARIEKALKIKEVKYAKWDRKSKMLTVAYLSPSITLDSLQQRLAAVGHDTEKFKAPDAVYSALPECCLFRDNATTH
jgi:periplasmic mercuric ion binding protein